MGEARSIGQVLGLINKEREKKEGERKHRDRELGRVF